MRFLLSTILTLSLFSFVLADPVFPVSPNPPTPTPSPAPTPSIISTVNFGELYFITSDVEYIWKILPEDTVKITTIPSGSLVVGKFAGGTATDEERTFTAKFVYRIKPLKTSTVTLIGSAKDKPISAPADFTVQTLTIGPPTPMDPLTASVQTAFTSDPSSTKVADATSLSAVYDAVADSISSVKTAGDLFTILSNSTNTRIGDKLGGLRAIFGGELAKILPSDKTVMLSDKNKSDATAAFKKFVTVLDSVK